MSAGTKHVRKTKPRSFGTLRRSKELEQRRAYKDPKVTPVLKQNLALKDLKANLAPKARKVTPVLKHLKANLARKARRVTLALKDFRVSLVLRVPQGLMPVGKSLGKQF